ncbi:ATP dependent RNA helicase DDX11 [Paragonimus heterotremus]|uniref:ATP dependent RNA helicase DDX11 n=1 Tax=Paragonimus heterotremus TaxID=100268 RepID=A0A8J4WJM1_9TREM|nr:ATP dependent RNA helicase DDX11 [Paragonimus heterotremus]
MEDFTADIEGDSLLASVELDDIVVKHEPLEDCQILDENTRPSSDRIPVPTTFPDFPYPTPYSQQISLMRSVYQTLEEARCGLFESPTGTGKSLSLLTASLRWLLDRNSLVPIRLEELNKHLRQMDSQSVCLQPDWVTAYEQTRSVKRMLEPEIERLEAVKSCLNKIADLKASYFKQSSQLLDACVTQKVDKQYSELYGQSNLSCVDLPADDPTEELFLSDSLHEQPLGPEETNPDDTLSKPKITQIIYCSRTHSQLSQVLDELSKCQTLSAHVSVIQLASRQTLCTNRKVYQLQHSEAINEACLELGRSKSRCSMRNAPAVKRLSDYLLSGASAPHIACSIRENSYSSLFGKRSNSLFAHRPQSADIIATRIGCPYYATRESLPTAQLVLVPYATVLQQKTRDAFGLTLADSILIIDEAHNLLEATTASLSVLLQLRDLQCVLIVLRKYQQHYRARLSSLVALRLRQLIQFVQSLQRLLLPPNRNRLTNQKVVTIPLMLCEASIDNISLHHLIDCLRQRHFVTKLAGFAKWVSAKSGNDFLSTEDESTEQYDGSRSSLPTGMKSLLAGMKRNRGDMVNQPQIRSTVIEVSSACSNPKPLHRSTHNLDGASSSLFKFQSFLEALVIGEDDARILINPSQQNMKNQAEVQLNSKDEQLDAKDPSLYFTVLNPGRYLQGLVRESRCVLLAGGTMQPFDELLQQVFQPAGKSTDNVTTFTCDHVIDSRCQLKVFPIVETRDGQPLEFTFQQRGQPRVMDECGDIILQIVLRTPAGVVVFLPSYDYQQTICSHWESSGLLSRLNQHKRVFREPKHASALNQVMQAYKNANTNTRTGAVLICVIGGKLSEGINFSDDLARAVVIVGMPYPNPHCPLLREKMAYLDSKFSGFGTLPSQQSPGKQHYETLCMRSINQAIGRAVRHAKDYAAVFLVDRRFSRASVIRQLPSWVQESLRLCVGTGGQFAVNLPEALEQLDIFFSKNRSVVTKMNQA